MPIIHNVWLKFNPETTNEDFVLFHEAMEKVATSVGGKMMSGKNIEPVLNKGFNYGMVSILPSKEALAEWQVCPAMKEAQSRFISKFIEDFCAVDLEVPEATTGTEDQANAQYDIIAHQYKEAKKSAWRKDLEEYEMFELLGDVTGKSVLDLACGEGHYTRISKQRGAARVVGVDISTKMIELAQEQEKNNPLGIEYVAADACSVPDLGEFDIVISAYLLTYAKDQEEAQKMWEGIYRSLKAGGKAVIIHFNMDTNEKYYKNFEPFGMRIDASNKKKEGDPITLRFKNPDNTEFSFNIIYLPLKTYQLAHKQAGFVKPIEWHQPHVNPNISKELQDVYKPLLGEAAMFCYIVTYK